MEETQSTLDDLWKAATRICEEIISFQPDVVVGLMHSGRIPLFAAIQVWRRTQPAPFPPTIYTNLGREKFARYNESDERPGIATHFIGTIELEAHTAYFLAWLVKQDGWQMELRE